MAKLVPALQVRDGAGEQTEEGERARGEVGRACARTCSAFHWCPGRCVRTAAWWLQKNQTAEVESLSQEITDLFMVSGLFQKALSPHTPCAPSPAPVRTHATSLARTHPAPRRLRGNHPPNLAQSPAPSIRPRSLPCAAARNCIFAGGNGRGGDGEFHEGGFNPRSLPVFPACAAPVLTAWIPRPVPLARKGGGWGALWCAGGGCARRCNV